MADLLKQVGAEVYRATCFMGLSPALRLNTFGTDGKPPLGNYPQKGEGGKKDKRKIDGSKEGQSSHQSNVSRRHLLPIQTAKMVISP